MRRKQTKPGLSPAQRLKRLKAAKLKKERARVDERQAFEILMRAVVAAGEATESKLLDLYERQAEDAEFCTYRKAIANVIKLLRDHSLSKARKAVEYIQIGTVLSRIPRPEYECTTIEAFWEVYKISEIKRPMPRVVRLRREKALLVTRSVQPVLNSGWGLANELQYQQKLKEYHKWQQQQNHTEGEKYAKEDDMQRDLYNARSRRKKMAFTVAYTLSRAGLQKEAHIALNTYGMLSVADAYYKLRGEMTHARALTRLRAVDMNSAFPRSGGVHRQPNSIVHRALIAQAEQHKEPKTSDKCVGIELEFNSKASRIQIVQKLHARGLLPYVQVKGDGSVRVSDYGDCSHELALLVPEAGYSGIVSRVCAALKECGGYVNKTCGMHVHLDMRTRDTDVKECYRRLVLSLEILVQMTPYERRHNKYCKRNSPDISYDEVCRMTDRSGDIDRYWAINPIAFHKHGTLEVRMHSGTLNPIKIDYWVQLLLLLVNTPNEFQHRDPAKFCEVFKLPPALTEYVIERCRKFAPSGRDTDDEHVQRILDRDDGLQPSARRRGQCYCGQCQVARDQSREAA